MRNHKKLMATFLTFCLILLTAVPSFAATPGQALDGGEVKYKG